MNIVSESAIRSLIIESVLKKELEKPLDKIKDIENNMLHEARPLQVGKQCEKRGVGKIIGIYGDLGVGMKPSIRPNGFGCILDLSTGRCNEGLAIGKASANDSLEAAGGIGSNIKKGNWFLIIYPKSHAPTTSMMRFQGGKKAGTSMTYGGNLIPLNIYGDTKVMSHEQGDIVRKALKGSDRHQGEISSEKELRSTIQSTMTNPGMINAMLGKLNTAWNSIPGELGDNAIDKIKNARLWMINKFLDHDREGWPKWSMKQRKDGLKKYKAHLVKKHNDLASSINTRKSKYSKGKTILSAVLDDIKANGEMAKQWNGPIIRKMIKNGPGAKYQFFWAHQDIVAITEKNLKDVQTMQYMMLGVKLLGVASGIFPMLIPFAIADSGIEFVQAAQEGDVLGMGFSLIGIALAGASMKDFKDAVKNGQILSGPFKGLFSPGQYQLGRSGLTQIANEIMSDTVKRREHLLALYELFVGARELICAYEDGTSPGILKNLKASADGQKALAIAKKKGVEPEKLVASSLSAGKKESKKAKAQITAFLKSAAKLPEDEKKMLKKAGVWERIVKAC